MEISTTEKIRSLAAKLRGLIPGEGEWTSLSEESCGKAADAIDLLLAEVEAAKEQSRKWQALTESSQQVAEMAQRRADKLRAELEAAAADKRDQFARLLAIIEKDSEWADARAVDWTRGVLMATLKVALVQRQGEGS